MPYLSEESILSDKDRFFFNISLPTCLATIHIFYLLSQNEQPIAIPSYVYDCGLTFTSQALANIDLDEFNYLILKTAHKEHHLLCSDPEPDFWTIGYRYNKGHITEINCGHWQAPSIRLIPNN